MCLSSTGFYGAFYGCFCSSAYCSRFPTALFANEVHLEMTKAPRVMHALCLSKDWISWWPIELYDVIFGRLLLR